MHIRRYLVAGLWVYLWRAIQPSTVSNPPVSALECPKIIPYVLEPLLFPLDFVQSRSRLFSAMEAQKEGRATTACTECQRRKQKVGAVTLLLMRCMADNIRSALANGHVIIARREKLLIYANLPSRSSNRSL